MPTTYIVFDSTALCRTYRLQVADWDSLAQNAERWGIRLAVPWTAVEETIANFQRDIAEQLRVTKLLASGAKKAGVTLQLESVTKQLDEEEGRYRQELEQRLTSLGIEILPISGISHEEVVKRAVGRRRPCDGRGNGYRDTLNWLTVMALAQAHEDSEVIWVSEDSDFREQKSGPLHEHLVDDLVGRGLVQRVRLMQDLSEVTRFVQARHIRIEQADAEWAELSHRATVEILSALNTEDFELRVIECGLPFTLRSGPAILSEIVSSDDISLDRLDEASEIKLIPFRLAFKARCGLRVFDRASGAKVPDVDSDGNLRQIEKDLIGTGYVRTADEGVVEVVELAIEAPENDPVRIANRLEKSRRDSAHQRIVDLADYLGESTVPSSTIDILASWVAATSKPELDRESLAMAGIDQGGLSTRLAELIGANAASLAAVAGIDQAGLGTSLAGLTGVDSASSAVAAFVDQGVGANAALLAAVAGIDQAGLGTSLAGLTGVDSVSSAVAAFVDQGVGANAALLAAMAGIDHAGLSATLASFGTRGISLKSELTKIAGAIPATLYAGEVEAKPKRKSKGKSGSRSKPSGSADK